MVGFDPTDFHCFLGFNCPRWGGWWETCVLVANVLELRDLVDGGSGRIYFSTVSVFLSVAVRGIGSGGRYVS